MAKEERTPEELAVSVRSAVGSAAAAGGVRKVREKDAGLDKGNEVAAMLQLKLRCISLMHEVGGFKFSQVDKLFSLPAGTSSKLAFDNPSPYELWTQAHIDACVQRFYRAKITLLEHLVQAAPRAIKMWKQILEDENPDTPDKKLEIAAKEIREWTSLFLRTKQSSAVRDLLSTKMKDDFDRAEEMEASLQSMLGPALSDEIQ